MHSPDLTSPTRVCGAIGTFNEPAGLDCMRDLGFSEECLSIWWYNVINTREECTLVNVNLIRFPT